MCGADSFGHVALFTWPSAFFSLAGLVVLFFFVSPGMLIKYKCLVVHKPFFSVAGLVVLFFFCCGWYFCAPASIFSRGICALFVRPLFFQRAYVIFLL